MRARWTCRNDNPGQLRRDLVFHFVCPHRGFYSYVRGRKWLGEVLRRRLHRAWGPGGGGLDLIGAGSACSGWCRCREWFGLGLWNRSMGHVFCTWSVCSCSSLLTLSLPVSHRVWTSLPSRSTGTLPSPRQDQEHTYKIDWIVVNDIQFGDQVCILVGEMGYIDEINTFSNAYQL